MGKYVPYRPRVLFPYYPKRVHDRVSLRRSYFVDEDQSPFNAEVWKNKQGKNKIPKGKTRRDGLCS